MSAESLAVIVARGASKRLPRKNLRPLMGVPLVAWSIAAALASKASRVVVTTEDAEIAAVARQYGADVPFIRPAELAEDYARSDDILIHALDATEKEEGKRYPVVVYIQPTTPFMQPKDIDAAIDMVATGGAACCFTAREVGEPPWWMFVEDAQGRARLLMEGSIEGDREHAQKLAKTYFPSGAVWALNADALRAQHRMYCEPLKMVMMDYDRSIDIDDETDLAFAETIAQRHGFVLYSSGRSARG